MHKDFVVNIQRSIKIKDLMFYTDGIDNYTLHSLGIGLAEAKGMLVSQTKALLIILAEDPTNVLKDEFERRIEIAKNLIKKAERWLFSENRSYRRRQQHRMDRNGH